MLRTILRLLLFGAAAVLPILFAACGATSAPAATHTTATPTASATFSVFASGLNNPRGLAFGPDDKLYVSNNGFGIPKPGAGQIVRINPAANSCA